VHIKAVINKAVRRAIKEGMGNSKLGIEKVGSAVGGMGLMAPPK
jgi:hypothetical protein